MNIRELDALIAEKVMGIPRGEIYYTVAGQEHITERLELYSTDIAAAWKVVEQMRADFVLDLQDRIVYWDACFLRFRGVNISILNQYTKRAPTAAEAICLAALKARGVEVSE